MGRARAHRSLWRSCRSWRPAAAGRAAAPSAQARRRGQQVFRGRRLRRLPFARRRGSKGTVGPNLDALQPSADLVERAGARRWRRHARRSSPSSTRPRSRPSPTTSPRRRTGPSRPRTTPSSPTTSPSRDCEKRLDASCYEQAFGNLAYERGPAVALREFQQAIVENPVVESRCHPIAHRIGAGALLRFHGDVGRAFADGSPACGSGYYHGLLAVEARRRGRRRGRPAWRASSARTSASSREPFTHYQCVHGLGHGLMLYAKYDLPRALDLCHELPVESDSGSRAPAASSWRTSRPRSAPSRSGSRTTTCSIRARSSRPPTSSTATCSSPRTSCPRVNSDWAETARWCRKSDAEFVKYCFQSMGRDASGYARQEPAKILGFCAAAGDMRDECLFGAGARHPQQQQRATCAARRLCETAPASARAYCFFGLGSILGVVHPDEAARSRPPAPASRRLGTARTACAARVAPR